MYFREPVIEVMLIDYEDFIATSEDGRCSEDCNWDSPDWCKFEDICRIDGLF